MDFFKANILDYRISENYDIIFSSGVFHYIAHQHCMDVMIAEK